MENQEETENHDNSRDKQLKNWRANSSNHLKLCKPYPFEKYHDSLRYIVNSILDVTESGPLNLIEPCHEYKAFINTTDETRMIKFTSEVIRFGAACMNSRTNGTIHFGIGDKPDFTHGQVLGVVVEDKEAYVDKLKSAIYRYFEQNRKQDAETCIKPPRFVEVLSRDTTSYNRYVIEVDIVPDFVTCEKKMYHTFKINVQSEETVKTKTKQLFVRDGGSSRNLLAPTTSDKKNKEYKKFFESVAQRSQLRKQAEEKHLAVIKSSTQGSRLSQMITGGSHSLDKSHCEQYVIVTKNWRANSSNHLKLCKPYPFEKYHDSLRYIVNSILDVTESGPLNLIEPCHEYKAFINTTNETRMIKFTSEVIRFGAACMNRRTNGTIHFGIGDKPDFIHGQVLGVVVEDKEAYVDKLNSAIYRYFEQNHKQDAQVCIKPPRFVEVLSRDTTSCNRYVIEVDIVPDFVTCEKKMYHTFKINVQSEETVKTKTKQLFVRDGGSSRNLLAPTTSDKKNKEYKKFFESVAQRSQLRKQAEEKHLAVIKSSTQGSRLSQMITGGSHSLDKSHFEQYVIVTNKSHPSQFESLRFLSELNPIAVLDFDPESTKHGLQCHFRLQSTAHLPTQYKITDGVEDIANKLKLTRNTSWVFCNGGIEDEVPSDIDQWLMDKGASVRDVISFLCRKDVLPNKRFLVVFLLLSTVSEMMDPLVETFSTFCQELRGTEQILCICDNENAFTSWTNLIEAQCGINISGRCIYELSLAEVNGTILSLLSKNRRASRFLPCGGGSKVILEKKVERSLNTLDVLCVNQCDGGNEDKFAIEENFYRGGKVSWWNFYFSEQLIKQNHTDSISNNIQDMCSCSEICILYNLIHAPGCGGTTLAKHTLWAHREKFRCAILKDNNADFAEVADQVVKLLMFDHEEKLPRVPVLLMIDDFDDMRKVFFLQQLIEQKCKKNLKTAQVILLNCMRSESPEQTEMTEHGIYIGKHLKEEKIQFEKKLLEKEKTHRNVTTFYTFMLMKKNLKPAYIQGVVHNTLRSFNVTHKHSQLLAILSLLTVYCKDASLPFCLCRRFLGLNPNPICGTDRIEDVFGKFSNFIRSTTAQSEAEYRAVKMIHSNIAKCCLQELKTTHKMTKADITNLVLRTHELYEHTEDKGKFLQDVHNILVEKYSAEKGLQTFIRPFSIDPVLGSQKSLIKDIESETPELVEMVLLTASKRFKNDASITHILEKYYSQTQDFKQTVTLKPTRRRLFSFPLERLQIEDNLRN